ncbi:hypothetical protein LCGC14_1106890 [marine sediment metagenome]|uniref:Uncharacterized protein n=1 Tax=marine sediment metagenome TaxID=412755 RepID=A0A0F9MVS6_9ZZZZ
MGRPSNKDKILKLSEEHPRWTKERIALEIGCSLRTVQRHLPAMRPGGIVKTDNTNDNINDIKNHDHLNPPEIDDSTFIDDPNELLMSCAMRELNKPNPKVQWGNILLTLLDKTKQLEAKSKKEVMIRRKLVPYSSNQLIELRKRLIKS